MVLAKSLRMADGSELLVLEELGFGLDLTECAATGARQELVYVSPKSGRAVSRAAGQPWQDKMLALPAFLVEDTSPCADLSAIETQFHHLVRIVPKSGRIVANAAEASLLRVIERGCWSELEWFNDAAGWSVAEGAAEDEVVIRHLGKEIGRKRLPLSGTHNRANALAAIAAARHVGVTPEVALDALTRFEGVKRRLELRGTVRGVAVYDDFAHHPTAIALTVGGMRRQVGDARILAVLEPRSNTMKLGVMKDQLPASLEQADKVFCYAANLGWDARGALEPIAAKTVVEDDLDALVKAIVAEAKDGDRILVMSNGGFGGIHGKLLAALAD